MTFARTADLVRAASGRGRAVLAFNVITLEHAEGILDGAERAGAHVVLQVSENAARYHASRLQPILRACSALVEEAGVSASLHLDHIQDTSLIDAIEGTSVTSVMVDASHLPYDDNVAATRAVTARLHDDGLWVEGELGRIGGKGGAHDPGVRTDPQEAARFVGETGIDALAVAVGSRHAMTDRTATIDVDLVARIASAVSVPLVLHGSSGVPVEQLARAAAAGMRKINVGTALNVAYTAAVREQLAAEPDLTDPRRYLTLARDRIADVVHELLRSLG